VGDVLPPPPAGTAGWPWYPVGISRPVLDGLPRITVVIPSFNQGQFVEATLRSILLQGYPDLEVIVVDGGSTDGSVDVIRRYASWLSYWHSRKDEGQAAAIRAGFEIATGSIYCWVNSDDILLPNALNTVGSLFARKRRVDVIYGNRLVIDRHGAVTGRHVFSGHLTAAHWAVGQPLAQECCFWRRAIYERVGGVDPTSFFIMDYDLFFRMWRSGRFYKTPEFLGCFRVHEEAKNARHRDVWRRELAKARMRYQLRDPGYLGIRLLNRFDRAQHVYEAFVARFTGAYHRDYGLPYAAASE
jgi:glycosyltransferase involved in cell wall biosynthesis